MENLYKSSDTLGPLPITGVQFGLISAGSVIAGFAGGTLNLLLVFIILGSIRANDVSLSPYLLSMIAFFSILATTYLNIVFHRLVFPDKYRNMSNVFTQVSIFTILVYSLITPLYVFVSISSPENIIFIFTLHVILSTFGTNLITESLSTYRYLLIGVYGAFVGLLLNSTIFTVLLLKYGTSNTALYGFVGIIITTNLFSVMFRAGFELAYHRLYLGTGWDPLGDMYAKIEDEEREAAEEARKNMERF